MSIRITIFALLLFGSLQHVLLTAQLVGNPDFDNKIDHLLDYHVPVVSVTQAHSDSTGTIIYLDARERKEYDVSHIINAKHVGYDDFNISTMTGIDKNAKIIVYCSIGYRSDKIGGKLKKAGYRYVNNLYGSIFEWVNRGFPVVDKNDHVTFQLHTYNKKWSKWVENPKIEKVW